MFKPIERKSLADSVYEQLRDAIVGGEFPAGSSLPSERQLREQLGVNRGALREALKRLEEARRALVALRQRRQALRVRAARGRLARDARRALPRPFCELLNH